MRTCSASHDLVSSVSVSQRVKGLFGCRRWVIKHCVYYCEEHRVRMTQLCQDPVTELKCHMTTPGHIQSISKGTRNYMLQRSLFSPLPVSFLEWFISPALLSSTWQNTAHIHYCPLTTSLRGCHGNIRPCLLLCRSHCLFPGTAEHMFSHRLYEVLPISDASFVSIL